jgi:hypothetical protein
MSSAEGGAPLSQAPVSSADTEDSTQLSSSQAPVSAAQSSGKTQAKSQMALSSGPAPKTDTLAPKLELQPPSGIYQNSVQIEWTCSEARCRVESATNAQGPWAQLQGTSLTLSKSQNLWFRGVDTAGNYSEVESREYVVKTRSDACPRDMVPVGNGPKLCVDTYEWPNRRGEKPKTGVTLAQADSLCQSVGKRLCSTTEWTSACEGGKGNRFAYGQSYEASSCNTDTKSSQRSGYTSNCRTWDGIYDMGGNVWEWTSTPARGSYQYVAGGSWDARQSSSCSERKYSFFPQNEYPMVGLRCCKDPK